MERIVWLGVALLVAAGAVLWIHTGGNQPDTMQRVQSKLWGCETAHVEQELDARCRSLDRDGLLVCQDEQKAGTTYPAYMWCERRRGTQKDHRKARSDTSTSGKRVTVAAKHPSFVELGPVNGIGYLAAKDRVAVWVRGEGSIPDPITDVTVTDTDGTSVTLRFASEQDASRFTKWLMDGVPLLVPLEYREGLVPEVNQGGGPFTEGQVGLGSLIPDAEGGPMGRCAQELTRSPPLRSAKELKRRDLLRLCRELDELVSRLFISSP